MAGGLTLLVVRTIMLSVLSRQKTDAQHRFWGSVLQGNKEVLISPGSVVFSQNSLLGTRDADHSVLNPFLSFENGLAMGPIAALVNGMGGSYAV
jgi:hypothetical protein